MKKIESLFDFKAIGDQDVARRFDALGLDSPTPSCLGLYILDERGEPVAEPYLFKWGQWLEEATTTGARQLGDDSIGPYRVSTIFLGLNHAYGGGPPVLWETMIFGTQGIEILPGRRRRFRKTVNEFRRYTSKTEALAGHARAVKLAESLPHPVAR